MKMYCRKTILGDDENINAKETMIDDAFDEIVEIKLSKIQKQIRELKILKGNSKLTCYDKAIFEVNEILKTYKSKKKIKKTFTLYDDNVVIAINYPEKNFKVIKQLPSLGYTSNREYYLK